LRRKTVVGWGRKRNSNVVKTVNNPYEQSSVGYVRSDSSVNDAFVLMQTTSIRFVNPILNI